jgi:hypothetical protein
MPAGLKPMLKLKRGNYSNAPSVRNRVTDVMDLQELPF